MLCKFLFIFHINPILKKFVYRFLYQFSIINQLKEKQLQFNFSNCKLDYKNSIL